MRRLVPLHLRQAAHLFPSLRRSAPPLDVDRPYVRDLRPAVHLDWRQLRADVLLGKVPAVHDRTAPTCAVCDVAFHTNRPQAHCSTACAMVGKLRYDRAYNARRPKPARSCACGSPLNGRRLKCDACRLTRSQIRRRDKRRRRALKLGVPTERYTLAEIAQRDRRTCQLCRKRVAMTKVVPHPKAPTIDHVVPLADGGSDLRSNVQLAHFLCNSTKSNRGTQQLILVG